MIDELCGAGAGCSAGASNARRLASTSAGQVGRRQRRPCRRLRIGARRRRRRRSRTSCVGRRDFWPQPLILFTKLIWTSCLCVAAARCSADDPQERFVCLPARPGSTPARRAPTHRDSARRRSRAGRRLPSPSRVRSSSLRKPGQPVDEQHAVEVERLVEADQPRLVARRPRDGLARRESRPGRRRRAGGRAGSATPRNQRWLCGTGTSGASGKISPASRSGNRKPREPHSTASHDWPSGSRARRLQTLGQPGLQFAQGLLVRHSQRLQSKARILAISSSASTGLTM